MINVNIPDQYRELSERKAALLAGVSRSTFRRRHLEADSPESITLVTRQDGTSFIPFMEVHRLYGERSLENLKKIDAEPLNQQNQLRKNGLEPIDTTPENVVNLNIDAKKGHILPIQLTEYLELKTSLASKSTELEQLKKRLEEQNRLLEDSKDREAQERKRADRLFEEVQNSRRLLEDKLTKAESQKVINPLASLWPPNWFKG